MSFPRRGMNRPLRSETDLYCTVFVTQLDKVFFFFRHTNFVTRKMMPNGSTPPSTQTVSLNVEGTCETSSNARHQRIAAHTHIKGLGLSADGTALPVHMGMVGQTAAREAAGVIVDLIKTKSMGSKAIFFAGPSGTGKTAIALAISQELGPKVPFCPMVASEVFSQEVKKTEALMENFRRAIGLRIKETKEVYEGEVVELTAEETENPHGGYAKTVSAVVLTLKTAKGTKTLRLAPEIHRGLQKEKVRVGDVVFIQANSGAVKRVGRSDHYASEFDLEVEEYVPIPKGEVYKKKELVQDVTLHDLDVANAKPQGDRDITSILNQFLKTKKTEITDKLRAEVNKSVNRYIDNGMAELIPGVLFIDEVHMLDIECFSFLNRVLESPLSPVVILATNRGVSRVRGTEILSPHGIPGDLLDRLIIVLTKPYTCEEIIKVVALRAAAEKVQLQDDAIQLIGELGEKTSLRYVIQLLTPAKILATTQGRSTIHRCDIEDADALFLDARSSARRLKEEEQYFL